ncbi:EAL domain-containing protein [Novosphingobium sp. FSY-8]|uniref:EAL domain-containing protein n=1 Tax=Novosphingobium ovatum TaxID=1908523 RepID=A0ABW9XCA1_9SPHN|nr:EAL domain-containing protein [Novosphingobium ovatum]NBC36164.1 EAL domain-containing protein [Novosphingobium ovatum]
MATAQQRGTDAQDSNPHAGMVYPILWLAVLALAGLTLTVLLLSTRFDTAALRMQQQMALRGFINRQDEVATMLTLRLTSDDAASHLTPRIDPVWVDRRIAADMARSYPDSHLFVLDANGRPQYAAWQGQRGRLDSYAPFAFAARQAIGRMQAYGQPQSPLNQARNLVAHGGRVYLLTVIRAAPTAQAPLVVSAVATDNRMASRFGLFQIVSDMTIATGATTTPDRSMVALYDLGGRPVANINWSQMRPAQDLLANLKVPLLAMLGVFAMVAYSLMRQAGNVARSLMASEARARHLAHHDPLTQLPNRALMFSRLSQLLAMARRTPMAVAVHCLDLDRFKDVNDTLGHPAGDELIIAVGRRITALIREGDTLARLGGDEFVVLQPHASADGASHLAERIVEALRAPFDLTYGQVEIGCSIGITLVSDSQTSATEAIRQADLALYGAKENGRGRAAFFEAEMDAALRRRRALEGDLRRAMAQGDLHMVYQAQVDEGRHVVGLEALVRWTHPAHGNIPPVIFVPLAEECGLIGELGEYILGRVFADTAQWRHCPVAINISALQLRQTDFMASITRQVALHAADPANYEIEITETVLLGDDPVTRDNIAVLKQEGFTIALDDFGTGYSSLSSLQRFAIDKIKIDRLFVRNIQSDDPETRRLVHAVIQLGQSLGLEVIAEGVETETQMAQLLTAGCRRFQGYLFGMPMPADALPHMRDVFPSIPPVTG